MKFLSIFKITKGFKSWLKMYNKIEPNLNELGIKVLWVCTNPNEIQVIDITEVNDTSKFEVLTKSYDITEKRANATIKLQGQEVIETITKDYWA